MCGCAMGGAWSWMMGPLGVVLTIGFWGLLAWGGYALFKGWSRGGRRRGAEHVLARRFAAGDIGEDEFRNRVDTLRAVRDDAPWDVYR